MGEGWGEGGRNIVPPPLHPLPPGEGKILEGIFKYANGRERQTKNVNGCGVER